MEGNEVVDLTEDEIDVAAEEMTARHVLRQAFVRNLHELADWCEAHAKLLDSAEPVELRFNLGGKDAALLDDFVEAMPAPVASLGKTLLELKSSLGFHVIHVYKLSPGYLQSRHGNYEIPASVASLLGASS